MADKSVNEYHLANYSKKFFTGKLSEADISGELNIDNKDFLYSYYCNRKRLECKSFQCQELKSFIEPCIDLLVREIRIENALSNVVMVKEVLEFKSALCFLSQDFPDQADTILYSPLMRQLDDIINSWPLNEPPFRELDNVMEAMRDWNHDHVWWNMLDSVELFKGKCIMKELTAAAKYQLQNETTYYEMVKEATMRALKVLEKAQKKLADREDKMKMMFGKDRKVDKQIVENAKEKLSLAKARIVLDQALVAQAEKREKTVFQSLMRTEKWLQKVILLVG